MRINPEALTAWREERGYRKTDLANEVGISIGYLCDLETGRKGGSPPTIKKIAEALKVRTGVLIESPT